MYMCIHTQGKLVFVIKEAHNSLHRCAINRSTPSLEHSSRLIQAPLILHYLPICLYTNRAGTALNTGAAYTRWSQQALRI